MDKRRKISDDKISKAFTDTDLLTRALQSGITTALQKHRQAGNSVCVWRSGKIVWIPADRIPEIRKRK